MSNQDLSTSMEHIRLSIRTLLIKRQQNPYDFHIKDIMVPLSDEGLDTWLKLIEDHAMELLTIASGAAIMKGNVNIQRDDVLQASLIQERGVDYVLSVNR